MEARFRLILPTSLQVCIFFWIFGGSSKYRTALSVVVAAPYTPSEAVELPDKSRFTDQCVTYSFQFQGASSVSGFTLVMIVPFKVITGSAHLAESYDFIGVAQVLGWKGFKLRPWELRQSSEIFKAFPAGHSSITLHTSFAVSDGTEPVFTRCSEISGGICYLHSTSTSGIIFSHNYRYAAIVWLLNFSWDVGPANPLHYGLSGAKYHTD